MSIDINAIDFHDAVFDRVSVDSARAAIFLRLQVYASDGSRQRNTMEIEIRNVQGCSFVADFMQMQENAGAGNVMMMRTEPGKEKIFLYLCDGILEVKGGTVSAAWAD